jgi:hypothetical protein
VATQQPKYVTTEDGRRITYARWRYEEQVKQEAVLKQVNDLITQQATAVVSVGANLDLQEYGGLLREVIPTLLDQFGNINAQAAIDYYNAMQIEWLKTYGDQARSMASRGNVNRAASRNAAARTQGALQVAQGYTATFADTYDVVSKTDAVVNFAMKVRATQGHAPSVDAMNNALTREVAMYHRDTVLFNAALDPYVSRVQRVAQSSACEFCRLMALGSNNGKVRVSTYAVKFHDHCHCTIQPLFEGEAPVRPDYYDSFEAQYLDASSGGGSAKEILSNMRKTTN